MKYFLHDTNAMRDEKISELFINFGYTGTGLFFAILENIAFNEEPVSEKILMFQLKIKGKKLVKIYSFLFQIELIFKQKDKVFNENVLKVSQKYKIKKENTRKRVSEWRDKQENKENVTHYKSVRNTDVTLANKSKLNNIKEESQCSDFLQNQNDYKKELLTEISKEIFKSDIEKKYFQVTLDFQKLFIENLKEKNISTASIENAKGIWIDSIRLIVENDKHSLEDLRTVYSYLKANDFWKSNIRSTAKMRQKMETLLIQARTEKKSNPQQTGKIKTLEESKEENVKFFNEMTKLIESKNYAD